VSPAGADSAALERHQLSWPVALEPAVAGAAHDPQQPALGVAFAIAVEIAECPQKGLLHHIGSIGVVARQPARERIGGVEMRQRHPLEPAALPPLRDPVHARVLPHTSADRRDGEFIP